MTRRGAAATRIALLVAGLAFVAVLVRSAGPSAVVAALAETGKWVPILVGLELVIVAGDLFATARLLGSSMKSLSVATYCRAGALAYAMSILMPLGRAAGETARAAILASEIDLRSAAAACARVQTAALFATGAISFASAGAALPVSASLGALLAGNGVLCLAVGVGVLLAARSRGLRRWFPRWAAWLATRARDRPAAAPAGPGALATAAGVSFFGRIVQTAQYGVALHAAGGTATPRASFVAQGIHLLGATVGDAIPNQLGATEGAYDVFAPALGLANAPARALSIALAIRIVQLGLAVVALGVATALRQPPKDAPP
jgi:hypothetical protein